MLSATEVAAMRTVQGEALPDTCTRWRKGELESDGAGGFTEGKPDDVTYACRLAATSGRELEIAARVTAQRTVTITLPYDADVQAADELVINGCGYGVVAVLDRGAWSTALRVLATEA